MKVKIEYIQEHNKPVKRTGELIKEYKHYYLIQLGKYRTCISKADIICGRAKIRFLEG